jgi:hypothetical protein
VIREIAYASIAGLFGVGSVAAIAGGSARQEHLPSPTISTVASTEYTSTSVAPVSSTTTRVSDINDELIVDVPAVSRMPESVPSTIDSAIVESTISERVASTTSAPLSVSQTPADPTSRIDQPVIEPLTPKGEPR